MSKIIKFFFLSCLKATELIEKKSNFRLSFKERLQLKVHKMICDACKSYENQSTLIDEKIAHYYKQNLPSGKSGES